MSFFLALELVKVQCSAGIRGLKKKKSFRVFQVCFPSQIEPLNSNQTTPARPQPPKNGLWTETDAEKHQAIIQQQNIYRQQNDVNVLLPPCHKPYSSFHLVIRVVLQNKMKLPTAKKKKKKKHREKKPKTKQKSQETRQRQMSTKRVGAE